MSSSSHWLEDHSFVLAQHEFILRVKRTKFSHLFLFQDHDDDDEDTYKTYFYGQTDTAFYILG